MTLKGFVCKLEHAYDKLAFSLRDVPNGSMSLRRTLDVVIPPHMFDKVNIEYGVEYEIIIKRVEAPNKEKTND